jgi:DNA-directed RNA polymerase subunit RPC12/RpoP
MDPQEITHFKLCPSCGKQMRPIRASEIYECKECRVFVTEAVRGIRAIPFLRRSFACRFGAFKKIVF